MEQQHFSTTITTNHSPEEVFTAVNNVRGWWSEEIEGNTAMIDDEFSYHYQDVHRCKIKIIESIPGKKVEWLVLDNYFSFTTETTEWIGTQIVFEIVENKNQTQLIFTHKGLVPSYECYNACVNGWSQYIQQSLLSLINTGKGQPNASEKANTVHEIAARFNTLAQQEKWFEIQDELFADNIKSIEPLHSPWLKNKEGKQAVRKKGEDWVKRIEGLHRAHTSNPIVSGNYFAVGREMDITVNGIGRISINEIMLYEVKEGKIISEQFFY